MSAAEEKFLQAQAAVQKTQGLPYMAPPPPTHVRSESDSSNRGQPSSSGKPTAAAALYAQAISAQNRPAAGPTGSPSASSPSRPKPGVPQYLTAEQEKAALRRYEEAKRAVDRTQNSEFPSDVTPATPAPIAYESLFPAAASSSSRPSATDQPPPFNPSSVIPQSHLSEKERLRRAYEASDAAARARQNPSPPPPPLLSPPSHNQYTSALEEKEALRRKFEERDNAQAKGAMATQTLPRDGGGGGGFGPSTPERSPSSGRSPRGSRPTPLPPSASTTSRVLSAAEEKALLRAKLEARDAQSAANNNNNQKPGINGSSYNNNLNSSSSPITPPPLMPRPPVEYIKETQEEDARVLRMNDGEGGGLGPVNVNVFGDQVPSSSSRRGTPKPQGKIFL